MVPASVRHGAAVAYTDPINPVFDAVSPQPLYSFASGYTHVFSGRLVNYFNPAFSWYESLFGPADLQKTLAAFPIVLEAAARMLLLRRWAGWIIRGCRGGEPRVSSLTTTWRGWRVHTNCDSALTAGFSG